MKIKSISLSNFRKLKKCNIELSEKETIFVGANNSGKTTAMDALIKFLKTKDFKTQDFTLSNWTELNKIAEKWVKENTLEDEDKNVKSIEKYLPTLDLWLRVEDSELHYVSHIIPSLDWEGGLLGIRLRYEPKDMLNLIEDYIVSYKKSNDLLKEKGKGFSLWPKQFWDFCDRKMSSYFAIKSYLLDPEKFGEEQELSDTNIPLEGDIFKGIIKIDIINAQRGFSDAGAEGESDKKLSSQLRSYYNSHLNPSVDPTEKDIEALELIENAQKDFDSKLKESFKTSLGELEGLNYPGFGNPQIQLSTNVSSVDGLQHDSAVKYYLDEDTWLPEKYNGLGYQNLISIIFKLIGYRDQWMKVGKCSSASEETIEPLHLVLIEEPEAHLHAQVQQVFIKQAYKVLRNHNQLRDKNDFSTQLVISTHSSYIAHQQFESLRYFKRNVAEKIATSEVINLSDTFGEGDSTKKFTIRYLNTTHNDLFFADAVILVEGPAERILIPHFVKNNYPLLDTCYITVLEIGGSHAHRLKPLIEKLGLICLIITDIDSYDPVNKSKCQTELGRNLITNNDTLKSWHPKKSNLDDLLEIPSEDKIKNNHPVRVAYQVKTVLDGEDVYPYTFEDALVLENKEIFKDITATAGLLKKMVEASKILNIQDSVKSAYDAINANGVKKAEFALDILFYEDPEKIKVPVYIAEGLQWVEELLKTNKTGVHG